jgi:hypothetical protein
MTRLQRWLVAMGIILLVPACATTPELPKEVRIPIPVPCEIEQVPATELPVAEPDANVARKAAVAAARIELLKAENTRLRAANNSPCPTEIKP